MVWILFLGFLNCLLVVVRSPGHLLQNVEIYLQNFCQKCDNFNQRYVVKFSFFVPFFYIFRPTATKNAFEDNGGWFLAKAPIPYHSWLVRQLFDFEPSENMRKVWKSFSGFLSTATSQRKLRQGWPGWGEALTPGGQIGNSVVGRTCQEHLVTRYWAELQPRLQHFTKQSSFGTSETWGVKIFS